MGSVVKPLEKEGDKGFATWGVWYNCEKGGFYLMRSVVKPVKKEGFTS